jgi:hypothetical protein
VCGHLRDGQRVRVAAALFAQGPIAQPRCLPRAHKNPIGLVVGCCSNWCKIKPTHPDRAGGWIDEEIDPEGGLLDREGLTPTRGPGIEGFGDPG